MKTIWVTSLGPSPDPIKKLMSQMKTYGVEVQGHFWKDDLKKMAWMAAWDSLVDANISMWGILGSSDELLVPDNLYGLSMLAITAQAQRGLHFPVMILQTQGESISSEQLSTPLRGAEVMSASDGGLGARMVAKAHKPEKPLLSEYHLNIYGNEQIGQWFEVRPENSSWSGVMFGVSGAEIAFHAVGPSGSLPAKTVLNYPMEGLKLEMGGKEYTAWAAQNELDTETSYFVKVEGFPESIVFGAYSVEEAAEVFVVRLK
ncbi:MAG: hypothetical protein JSV50_04010 [Desulfobacteraceae bacterium]|nr:MAG: hypothetical protein JSV50_04010 [Desulfobacteraceae bacterium]